MGLLYAHTKSGIS